MSSDDRLRYGSDLRAWERWQRSRRIPQRALAALRRRGRTDRPAPLSLTGPADADLLIAFDTTNPATVGALREVAARARSEGASVAVLDAGDDRLRDPAAGSTAIVDPLSLRPGSALSIGEHLPAGAAAHALARAKTVPAHVLQHGLHTPFAPPLPKGARLLAWTQSDAEYWADDRADVRTTVVGSPVFAGAARDASTPTAGRSPLFVGQMHGAELSARTKLRTALGFCTGFDAVYRPHPSENDRFSRIAHRILTSRGGTIDTSAVPIAALDRPVVAMFSTAILEAAAAGLPSYGYIVDDPGWVRSFWKRYAIAEWGSDEPTHLSAELTEPRYDAVVAAITGEVLR